MTHTTGVQPVFFIYLLLIFTTGCASIASDYRKEAFSLMRRSFDHYGAPSDLYMVVELKNVKVHIVSDRKYFKWETASAWGSSVLGYATSGNDIYIFGKRLGDKLIVNQAILGHELNHLLNFKDPSVANPDRLDNLEICYRSGAKGAKC